MHLCEYKIYCILFRGGKDFTARHVKSRGSVLNSGERARIPVCAGAVTDFELTMWRQMCW